ncbi:hypothetical protein ALMP_83410 [Streptomyces sp. A012304]|nr:hypothetical protein ALMP_83410 [Streptomyces sp. A012304]
MGVRAGEYRVGRAGAGDGRWDAVGVRGRRAVQGEKDVEQSTLQDLTIVVNEYDVRFTPK